MYTEAYCQHHAARGVEDQSGLRSVGSIRVAARRALSGLGPSGTVGRELSIDISIGRLPIDITQLELPRPKRSAVGAGFIDPGVPVGRRSFVDSWGPVNREKAVEWSFKVRVTIVVAFRGLFVVQH